MIETKTGRIDMVASVLIVALLSLGGFSMGEVELAFCGGTTQGKQPQVNQMFVFKERILLRYVDPTSVVSKNKNI